MILATLKAKLLFGAGVIGALLLLWVVAHQFGRAAGVADERARWQVAAQKSVAAMQKLARVADDSRRAALTASATRIIQDRKEVDDASDSVPDQPVSARQRGRACIELRRQAARTGAAAPAC